MNKVLFAYLFIFCSTAYSQGIFEYADYVDPLPNAKYINYVSKLIIRPKDDISINSIMESGAIIISGSLSGNKTYTTQKADNDKIIIVKPNSNFANTEIVTVRYTSVIKQKDGTPINPVQYSFSVSEPVNSTKNIDPFSQMPPIDNPPPYPRLTTGEPQITVTYSRFPSPGKLFFNNLVRGSEPNIPTLMIVENDGSMFYSKQMPKPLYDFNMQPNGLLTYYDSRTEKYYGMNENYQLTDSFYCGYGYQVDFHELRVLPNGNFLVMSYDTRNIDSIPSLMAPMTSRAIGIVLQEIDRERNVIFQWRSWDYFLISDATHENLNGALIDYCHSNAIEADNDGNWLLSSRNMDEITKIDRLTGKIIWRLGGKNNQFTFINDPDKFSHQHAVRRIKNGNITLYDNGNFHNPPYSRACEYKLDEVNKTATLVWQYRNNPDYYAPATGYVQRLPNNNTLICWGLTNPTLTEVRYDGTKVLEMTLQNGMFSYRAFRFPWKETAGNEILPSSYSLHQNYPNPFNPSTTIKFSVAKLSGESAMEIVKISIYDLNGRLVKVLVNEAFPSGTYSVNYNAEGIASGVYFYRADIGSFTDTRKMIFVK